MDTYLTDYPFVLHIGLQAADTDNFILNFVEPIADGVRGVALVHGDDWEEWGEKIHDELGERAFHVVIAVVDRAHALAALAEVIDQSVEGGWSLVPMQYDFQRNIIAVVSKTDWSEDIFTIHQIEGA